MSGKQWTANYLEASSRDFLAEVYKQTPVHHRLIDDWFKKVITYDLSIDESSTYRELEDGTFEVRVKINAARFETLATGETNPIELAEPIKVGIFTEHPSLVKDDHCVLYYESTYIDKEKSEWVVIVKQKPVFIAIDPYGTRSDENLADNVLVL